MKELIRINALFEEINFNEETDNGINNQEIFKQIRENLGYGYNDDFNFYPENTEEESRPLTEAESLILKEETIREILKK